MAGKVKSYYVTISKVSEKHKTVLTKQFFDAGSANAFIKEMEVKYPKPEYAITREYF